MKATLLGLEPNHAALDFAPEILAIERRSASPLPRAVLYTLLALLALLIVWAAIGKLDIVSTAQGRLVPETYVKIVQPADAGIVKELLVNEGDRVRAGQVLLRLDTTLTAADAAIVQREVESRSLQVRRIAAELAGKPMQRLAVENESEFQEVAAQGLARLRAYHDTLDMERAVLARALQDLQGAEEQVIKLEKLLPIIRGEEEGLGPLAQQGVIPKFQYSEKQRQRIDTEQNLASQRRTVLSLQSSITESKGRIARVTSEYRQQLLSENVEAQTALQKARQELAKQDHRGRLSELRAPQDGVIKDVATYTVGAVVSAGTVLMSLVPVDEQLVAEVYIRNEDVGFVQEGQTVKIKLATFPFQKYGMVEGTVTRISADAADPQKQNEASQAPEQSSLSPYKAIVALKQQSLSRGDFSRKLAPGMQVVAEIRQGERTVLEYLLSPVQKSFQEAARER